MSDGRLHSPSGGRCPDGPVDGSKGVMGELGVLGVVGVVGVPGVGKMGGVCRAVGNRNKVPVVCVCT